MTTNSLPPDIRFAVNMIGPAAGTSWGLGFAIRTNPDSSFVPGSVGSFNWSGAWGTYFWIDPVEKLIAVLMVQVPPTDTARFARALRFLTYAALRDPEAAAFTPPATPVKVNPDTLATYVGTYDFGASISPSDKLASDPVLTGPGIETTTQDGVLRVQASYRNGPAFKVGVIPGDIITHVDDMPIKGLGLDQVQGMLRGPVDTPVSLKIVHRAHDHPADVTVIRKMIRDAQLEARTEDGRLVLESRGAFPVLDFDMGKLITMHATSDAEFYVDGGDHTRIAFITDRSGKITGAVLNPGPREIKGFRVD